GYQRLWQFPGVEVGCPQTLLSQGHQGWVLLGLSQDKQPLGVGDYNGLLTHAQRLLVLAEAEQNPALVALAQQGLGTAYFYTGELPEALVAHQQALALAEQAQDTYALAVAYANVGETQLALGDSAAALAALDTALPLAESVGDPVLAGLVRGNLGAAYAVQGDYAQAQPYLEQALASERAAGTPVGIAQALNNLGNVLYLAGDFAAAEGYLREAIALWQSQRSAISDASLAVQFFDTQLLTYRLLQQVLVAQGQAEAALVAAEQGRAQVLASQLSAGTTPDLATMQAAARQHGVTLVEYSLIPNNRQVFLPGRTNNRTANAAEQLLIWVVQPSGEVRFEQVDLAAAGADLADLVAEARAALNVGDRTRAAVIVEATPDAVAQRDRQRQAVLQRLHALLIDPIAPYLPPDPAAPVVLMPQESLYLLPFAALMDADGQYLTERHTLLTAPSIQVWSTVQARPPRQPPSATVSETPATAGGDGTPLIVGNPTMPTVQDPFTGEREHLQPLPGTEREALALADLLGTPPLLGDAATEVSVKARLPQASLIHLATHGLLDYGDLRAYNTLDVPGAIALAPGDGEDGLLTAAEILEMNLQANLAVLSACDTGRGNLTGDGVIGLSRAFMAAGVPSVVVSLWAVPDAPTALLMTEFYRQLGDGLSPAQALQAAMAATRAQYPDPRNWAAFTLVGRS
ncbi:MAG: CHAT domain-containing tetratricopeptide repeat protein, partial [Cyanobacteria bacterium J06638_6]